MWVNTDGSPWVTSVTNQTPVQLTETAGTPEMVTLSVATDFASLTAGQIVTFNVWRDDSNTETSDLELYYAEFYYS